MEIKKQIFFDPGGRRARITNTLLVLFGAVFLGAVIFITAGVLQPPRIPVPPSRGDQPAATSLASDPLDPSPREPVISLAQSRSELADAPKRMRLAFFSDDDGLLSLKRHARDLDAIVPQWPRLKIGPKGPELRIDVRQNETLDWLRENAKDVSVYPELKSDLTESGLLGLFADASSRNALANQIVGYLRTYSLTGIVLNATMTPVSNCWNVATFLRELRARLSEDSRKTFAVVAPNAELGCLRDISNAVDYVISATQDEDIERLRPGAPASQGWFEAQLRRLVAAVPPSKLIVTIGAFASDVSWADTTTIIPVQRAWDILHRTRARLALDGNALNPSFAYVGNDGGQHRIWLLDGVTAFNQAKVAMAMPVAGLAVWRLGLEDPGVWDSIGRGRRPDADALGALEDPVPGYGNYRFLEGVLLSAGADVVGKRTLVYDQDLGLVVSEEITQPPLRGELGIWPPSDPKAVALTFDDGPDPRFTGKILDILRDKGVHATFYVIGRHVLGSPELVRRAYAEGHDIGSHTLSHPNPFEIDVQRLKIELNATQRILESVLGIQTNLFRPPYASLHFGYLDAGPQVVQTATQLGYVIGGIDGESCDFCGTSPDWIVRAVLDAVLQDHSHVILLHDSGGDRTATVAALPLLIDQLRAAGFHLVTTHEMAGLSREQIMHPWRPLAFLAEMERATWRKLIDGICWVGERGPIFVIATAALGVVRLLLIAIAAIVQFWIRRRRRGETLRPYRGSVDVFVPAFNEEKVICKTVEAILSSTMHDGLKVVVIDDGSKDRTAEVLSQQFTDEPRLTVLRKQNGGKAAALNYAFSGSVADVIVAIDGDTILCPDAIERLTAHFVDPRVGAVAGNVTVGNTINLMTRFQALEYVTSQNLDRRAFELFNAIGVVPGAIGAWRREAVLQAGGYARDTMAEDADLTFTVQLHGWRVLTELSAVALTEAPETLRAFMKQRFRWMFGTLQVACKHSGALAKRPTGLSLITIPNILVFQMLFTLLAPIMDAFLLWAVVGGFYFGLPGHVDTTILIAKYWLFFQTADCMAAVIGISLNGVRKYWRLLPLLLLQRFTYRQLLYVTAIRSILAALKGTLVGWGKLIRTGNVFGIRGVHA